MSLNIHRSVAIPCSRCRELVNVIADGQCVWCTFGIVRVRVGKRQGKHG